MLFEKYLKVIDEKAERACALSDGIWDRAELPLGEYESSELFCAALRAEGFTVTLGVGGLPTAFTAVYGEGRPVMGILSEYDALSGLSQRACVTHKEAVPGQNAGHGCGHNLFAGGSFAAALAVKEYIRDTGRGSVVLFGCPGEEGGSGKVFMARAGVFSGVDAVVSWHPERIYMVRTRPSLALMGVEYSFKGISAHAGGAPQMGRSALDAVELMNVGANFLREHMDLTSRLHYAIVDSGGAAPNVVQSHATVRYMIRAVDNAAVRELRERVERIAQGAALMTDTQMHSSVFSVCSDLITIPTMQQVAYEAMQDVPVPVPTPEDVAFGQALRESVPLPFKDQSPPLYQTGVLPPAPPKPHGGSTDTSDVSWNCPTVQMHIGTWCAGTPGHSWQSTAQGKSHYAKAAMLYAGKAVASTVMRLIEDPARLEQARAEHKERVGAGYVCPLPPEVEPALLPRA